MVAEPKESPVKSSEELKMDTAQVVLTKLDDPVASTSILPNGKNDSENTMEKVKKTRKRGRRRRLNPDAPKYPLTGYVRFTNERRSIIKDENPDKSHIDITKQLATEWTELPEDKKQAYMDEAEKDKLRYLEEMKEYSKTHEVQFRRKKKKKMNVNAEEKPEPVINSLPVQMPVPEKPLKAGERDIQIFTEDFLENNKEVESELKIMRKKLTDLELQNSNLDRYVESMKGGLKNLEAEHGTLNAKRTALEKYLKELKTKLVAALSGIQLPDKRTVTMDNIETFMHDLSNLSPAHTSLMKSKEQIRKLDFQSINT